MSDERADLATFRRTYGYRNEAGGFDSDAGFAESVPAEQTSAHILALCDEIEALRLARTDPTPEPPVEPEEGAAERCPDCGSEWRLAPAMVLRPNLGSGEWVHCKAPWHRARARFWFCVHGDPACGPEAHDPNDEEHADCGWSPPEQAKRPWLGGDDLVLPVEVRLPTPAPADPVLRGREGESETTTSHLTRTVFDFDRGFSHLTARRVGDDEVIVIVSHGPEEIRRATSLAMPNDDAADFGAWLVDRCPRHDLASLQAWKESAMTVLGEWDRVHEALGSPGPLGASKALSSLAEVERLAVLRDQLAEARRLLHQMRAQHHRPSYAAQPLLDEVDAFLAASVEGAEPE